jgi:exoribonuclease R
MANAFDPGSEQWLPSTFKDDDDIFAIDEDRIQLEEDSIQYLANLIQMHLDQKKQNFEGDSGEDFEEDEVTYSCNSIAVQLAKSRFHDLACTRSGMRVLEELFHHEIRDFPNPEEDVIRGAVIALQSLLILGTQVGVKGRIEDQRRLVSHLMEEAFQNRDDLQMSMNEYWDQISVKKLKHNVDTAAGIQILGALNKKRSSQGAFDLLTQIGAFGKHEDIALLRSGFPIHLTEEEERAAKETEEDDRDPDNILGLRKDLRHLKVYTIDGESTSEIDDGLSVELITKSDGSKRNRIWIHIADADRWGSMDTAVFEAAERRVTSLYLATGTTYMFPSSLSSGVMSLRAECDSCALSLALELNEDGSIDEETLFITPSLINVNYRLSFDEVDEMLDYGVGYFEEWELGAFLSEANKRRKFRIANGSTESFVPMPIPRYQLSVTPDDERNDVSIKLDIESTHNAGVNQSEAVLDSSKLDDFASPVSSGFLLVTEMMILAGEAMGKLKPALERSTMNNQSQQLPVLDNELNLPYRTQPKADLQERYQELTTLNSLREKSLWYCHAWFARRFFEPVRILSNPGPHTGLGLDCYVQWTSPIRRFSDLQVHAAVKRYLRIRRINNMMLHGMPIPQDLRPADIGCSVPKEIEESIDNNGKYTEYDLGDMESDRERFAISYKKGLGYIRASRIVQRKSNEYWLFEYIRRMTEKSESEVAFRATVLACVNPSRLQYAVYINELGLEHRYLSQKGQLLTGEIIWLKVASVNPRHGLLTFTLASNK